ncbi:NADPH-dependent F420 reductase [Paraburkholderia tropica]|uniref:NADPH-dependent F420 reductase n=1 Tax=Paraburkholderia tropica TaxID=92647 RepID=UPI00160332FE|nr:NADPH-dependent F420 reductase [Paraburkholderia tropica]QNB16072.1 NADPH-dependent F420 reductase [Paraburkholderia tropica]
MFGKRRRLLSIAAYGATLAVLSFSPVRAALGDTASDTRKIGVIGSGHVGGTLGRLWVKAGHEVMFSSRHPDELEGMVHELGAAAHAGTPREAAGFGDAILLAVPYGALPQLGRDLSPVMAGKVVLDACNPYALRDGEAAQLATQEGSGVASAHFFPGTRLVRGFNSIDASVVASEAHRPPPLVAVPLAGDNPGALAVAAAMVRDAGFDPVIVGPLAAARKFEPGSSLFEEVLTAGELRERIGIAPGGQ